jgi:phospholipase/carboxylesterase
VWRGASKTRSFATVFLVAAIAFTSASCRSGSSNRSSFALIEYVEVIAGEASEPSSAAAVDERLPLMIGIHGLGDTPQLFFRAFGTDMTARVRMVFPRAPKPHGEGYSWFDLPAGASVLGASGFADGVTSAGEALAELIERLVDEHDPPFPPIVFGYSQGGILSFYLAAHHADAISAAVPIAGLLPASLFPARQPPAPIFAFHGARDELVPVEAARSTVAAFRAAGGSAELREYSHLGHAVSLAVVRDAMKKLVELEAAGRARDS